MPGLPELVPRLDDEIKRSGLHAERCDELRERLALLAQGQLSRVCHFDLHPDNIIMSGRRWIVIDWLTAANGPPIADFARTLLLRANTSDPIMRSFTDALRHYARDRRGFDDAAVRSWMPVLAAARLAEGFDGPYAEWLVGLATTSNSEDFMDG